MYTEENLSLDNMSDTPNDDTGRMEPPKTSATGEQGYGEGDHDGSSQWPAGILI